MTLFEAASNYAAAGLCALPADRIKKYPSIGRKWGAYKKRLPTEHEYDAWFSNGHDGLCIVTGAASGNLEMLDFDLAGDRFDAWHQRVEAAAPGLIEKLVIETSQSRGWHAIYRIEGKVCGSLKLAQRKRPVEDDEITLDKNGREVIILCGKEYTIQTDKDGSKYVIITLIETRGEGGLFVCAPTPGYEVVHGEMCEPPVLTEEQRDILLRSAWELNEYVPPVVDGPRESAGDVHNGPHVANNSHNCHQGYHSGLRPGEDYSRRGDVRALLREYGWVLARGGDNEYWRRPGKKDGWSATLKNGCFYVFSSSAAPLEPNRAYSPFALYAYLTCGGDFDQAASALRQQGFGSDDDLVISGILIDCEDDEDESVPEIIDPGPIPEHLFHVPGFIERVMDFSLKNAPYPNVGLAFCGAISLQSFLSGRKVCDSGDLRTNIYLLALASSGTGKDFPRKVNARILFEIGQVASLGDKFASGEGIQDALARTGAMLFQNDEMDGVLRQINLDRENRRESIPNILLTVYTSANDIYAMRVKAGQKEAGHVDQPHLTLFGTATPQFFYESLSQRMLTNGFFARLIIVDIGKRGEGQKAGSVRNLPEAILQIARWWSEFQPGRMHANLQHIHPEPRIVPATLEAEEAMAAFQHHTEAEYDLADAVNDEVARVVWSRTHEHAKKLALIYACSANHENPIITLPAVEWGHSFAIHQTRRQLFLAGNYVAENPFHAECLKVIRKLRESSDQQLSHSKLLKRMKMKTKDFKELMDTLQQRGDVRVVHLVTDGRNALVYRLAGGERR